MARQGKQSVSDQRGSGHDLDRYAVLPSIREALLELSRAGLLAEDAHSREAFNALAQTRDMEEFHRGVERLHNNVASALARRGLTMHRYPWTGIPSQAGVAPTAAAAARTLIKL